MKEFWIRIYNSANCLIDDEIIKAKNGIEAEEIIRQKHYIYNDDRILILELCN